MKLCCDCLAEFDNDNGVCPKCGSIKQISSAKLKDTQNRIGAILDQIEHAKSTEEKKTQAKLLAQLLTDPQCYWVYYEYPIKTQTKSSLGIDSPPVILQNGYHKEVNPSYFRHVRSNSLYVPKCPTCGSPNIEKISLTSKVVGGALFGLFSSNVRKTMHCKNCGYKW